MRAIGSFRDHNPIVIGLVSLTAVTLAVVVTFLTGTLGLLDGGYTVSGVFTDTGGLRPGSDVRVAGVRVGKVTGVDPDFRAGRVIVSWKVDGGIKLGRGTRAEIKTANLLGGRYLRLSGPVAPPYLEDLPGRERRIPVERTQVPVTVNESLKSATRTISKLDKAAIGKIIDQLSRLSGNRNGDGRLSHALAELSGLVADVNESDPQVRELITNGKRVMSLVSAKDQQLVRLLDSAEQLLRELRERRDLLAGLLGDGSRTVQAMAKLIEQQQPRLTSLIDDLKVTMHTMGSRHGDLNELLAIAGPLFHNLTTIGGYGPWLEAIATRLGPLTPETLAGLAAIRPPGGRP